MRTLCCLRADTSHRFFPHKLKAIWNPYSLLRRILHGPPSRHLKLLWLWIAFTIIRYKLAHVLASTSLSQQISIVINHQTLTTIVKFGVTLWRILCSPIFSYSLFYSFVLRHFHHSCWEPTDGENHCQQPRLLFRHVAFHSFRCC